MGVEILLMTVFAGALLLFVGKRPKSERLGSVSFAVWAGALLLAAFSLRLYLGYYGKSFTSDMDTFKAWAYALNRTDLKEIYGRGDMYLDYPPGYLYVLLTLDNLRSLFHIPFDAPVYDLMLKLPSIFADMACGGVLLWAGKRKIGEKTALLVTAAYLFCPVILINSAGWGQVDSFCTAILLCSVLLLYREWYVPSALLYGLSIACKPQMLIFAPMYLFFAIRQKKWSRLPLGVLCAVGAILLTALPFSNGLDFHWLLEKYRSTLDYYNFYSINAYNFWTLLGWNWRGLPEGFSLQALTLAAPIAATVSCGLLLFLSRRKSALFACPALLMAVMFLFGVKMHERYLYPAFFFLLLSFLFTPDKRLVQVFAAVSAAGYLNVAHVMYLFDDLGGNYDANALLTRCMAGFQAAALVHAIYALFAVYLPESIQERPLRDVRPWAAPPMGNHRMRPVDYLLTAAVTGIYCIAAFWHLGSTQMPRTVWLPEAGESVVLQANETCDALYFLPGLAPDREHRAARTGVNVLVETSEDGKTWKDCGNLQDTGTYVFAWEQCYLQEPGRYIRLTAQDGNVVLHEIGVKLQGKAVLTTLEAAEAAGQPLVDEQDTVPLYATYENSAYFDEIYHARTAYEHILGLEPYENTHPPLGKYIISLGIRAFGMNPFGWRFMGTLFGVLMLPVLYHLLKQLFEKPSLCAAGTVLFAFDFMHFTQTRIATIDTYAVFFLLLMYDAMVVFLRRDIRQDSMKKLLPPLLCSGVFMGLGISAKWTAAYGALGLAALFFGKLILSFRDAKRAGENLSLLKMRSLRLCLWCCLFFVAIPFGTYFAVYLPLTTLPHNISNIWGNFWSYQTTMFHYHSSLVAEHYFASPWYEWPFVVRPIWYFSGNPVDLQGHYSTISAMGNPLLWWACIPALIAAVVLWIRERQTYAAVVLCGFLSVYLPWALVPRLTFIYHYFTAVPFLIIALIGVFRKLPETSLGRYTLTVKQRAVPLSDLFLWVFTGFCLILFFVYFPVISGAPTDKNYTDSLRLFSSWYF
ncbi:phospholipid carrier-dependent glycosyltransferase [uncultured Neglectibacter sp.]|uniref:phospholipid carrier-dependent glycosyltransferase n=1 Tax=uncultured Neglectibacter sp. TaxID=1924108 RepID=UPI0034E02CCA